MRTDEFNSGASPAMDLHPIQGEQPEILLVSVQKPKINDDLISGLDGMQT